MKIYILFAHEFHFNLKISMRLYNKELYPTFGSSRIFFPKTRRRHYAMTKNRFITFLFSLSKFWQEMVSSARIYKNKFMIFFLWLSKLQKGAMRSKLSWYKFLKIILCAKLRIMKIWKNQFWLFCLFSFSPWWIQKLTKIIIFIIHHKNIYLSSRMKSSVAFPEWNWNQICTSHYCFKEFLHRFSFNFWFVKPQQRI